MVVKLDAADIPLEKLFAKLSKFQEDLQNDGMGLYAMYATQGFSGCLNRQALLDDLVQNHNFQPPDLDLPLDEIANRMWTTRTRWGNTVFRSC